MKSSFAVLFLFMAAAAAMSVSARDFPEATPAADCGPLVPANLCQSVGGSMPNLPNTPPAASGGGSNCGPLIPPAVCEIISAFIPRPSTPGAGDESNCGPFIAPAVCDIIGLFLPPAPPARN